MVSDFPLPRIHPSWYSFHDVSVFNWDEQFKLRLEEWRKQFGTITIDYVDLDRVHDSTH